MIVSAQRPYGFTSRLETSYRLLLRFFVYFVPTFALFVSFFFRTCFLTKTYLRQPAAT